jgi:hypothetical protein
VTAVPYADSGGHSGRTRLCRHACQIRAQLLPALSLRHRVVGNAQPPIAREAGRQEYVSVTSCTPQARGAGPPVQQHRGSRSGDWLTTGSGSRKSGSPFTWKCYMAEPLSANCHRLVSRGLAGKSRECIYVGNANRMSQTTLIVQAFIAAQFITGRLCGKPCHFLTLSERENAQARRSFDTRSMLP